MSLALLVWQLPALVILGGSFFLRRAGPLPEPLLPWGSRVLRAWRWLVLAGLVSGGITLFLEATRILGALPGPADPALARLLTHTRFGQIWCLKQLLLLLIGVRLLTMRLPVEEGPDLRFSAGCFLVLGLYAGHGGTTEPVAISLVVHGLHALTAAIWAGALPLWWALWSHRTPAPSTSDAVTAYAPAQAHSKDAPRASSAGQRRARRAALERGADKPPHLVSPLDAAAWKAAAFSRFSTVAGWAMLALISSGVWIASRQFETWPAIFGTSAGFLLLGKLGLLSGALVLAAQLRQRWLPRLEALLRAGEHQPIARHIAVETVLAGVVLGLGYTLSRTTPGAHEEVLWRLPFRLAPGAAWEDTANHWPAVAALTAVMLAAPLWRARWRLSAGILASVGLAVLVWALSVPAWPGTYLRATVPYQANSISEGRKQFATHCAQCHGSGGRGVAGWTKSPAPGALPLPPDLSEHTALHTAGDMYWWLAHGMDSGAMPAFGSVLDDAERWSVVNFLRAFADGFRARVLSPQVAPLQPWLGAPDFLYETHLAENGRLRDFRDVRPVLLVVASLPNSLPRLAAMAEAWTQGRLRGLQPFVVPREGSCAEPRVRALALPCIGLGAADIAAAYDLLARTLRVPGARTEIAPQPPHAEFLIDRYGFLRARWLPEQEEGWSDPVALMREVAVLAAEPRVRESPDEHVH